MLDNSNSVRQVELSEGFPVLIVENSSASAKIALQGAHVYEYGRGDEPPVLWLSDCAVFEKGKAIRGGIPICWPWFGDHPDDDKPAHGFARTSMWELTAIEEQQNNGLVYETKLRFVLPVAKLNEHYGFRDIELTCEIIVGSQLSVILDSRNIGQIPKTITQALHSYLHVARSEDIAIRGLGGKFYLDKVLDFAEFQQTVPIAINGEFDRVYLDTYDPVVIEDTLYDRRIEIDKEGSGSTVVWNPGAEKASQMNDFPDVGYLDMVCVEAANAFTDERLLRPGDGTTIATHIK